MKINIIKSSIVNLGVLTGNAQIDFSQFMYGIEEAENIDEVVSMFPDDTVKTGDNEFHMLVKDNYQHVAACIKVNVINGNEARITFQSYD